MRHALYRTEPGRYEVNASCAGSGFIVRNNESISYKGLDVSRRGFGCVIKGILNQGDTVAITVLNKNILMQVMWVESHLGIEGMVRAGLTPIDRSLNLEKIWFEAGFISETHDVAS